MYLRIILFVVIVYLVIRIFRQFTRGDNNNDQNLTNSDGGKKVSKDVGEYVDYEDLKD